MKMKEKVPSPQCSAQLSLLIAFIELQFGGEMGNNRESALNPPLALLWKTNGFQIPFPKTRL